MQVDTAAGTVSLFLTSFSSPPVPLCSSFSEQGSTQQPFFYLHLRTYPQILLSLFLSPRHPFLHLKHAWVLFILLSVTASRCRFVTFFSHSRSSFLAKLVFVSVCVPVRKLGVQIATIRKIISENGQKKCFYKVVLSSRPTLLRTESISWQLIFSRRATNG